MNREDVIAAIIKREGGYVNDPLDSGGETNFGVTKAEARAHGYQGDMVDMPRAVAEKVYIDRFWNRLRADDLLRLSESVAEEVVDTGVNMGISRAGRFLQRSLNALNRRQIDYADLIVDGEIGPATITALKKYLQYRGDVGEIVLYRMLNCLQGAFYVELAERREKDEQFIFGWFLNRVY